MIVTVKSKKTKLKRIISLVVVALMFLGYYYHMEQQFIEQQKQEMEAKKIKDEEEARKNHQKKLERFLYKEIEKAVDLVGQENVLHVEVIKGKVLLVLEANTNIEPLMIRYGTMALVKRSLEDIKIAISVDYIIKSKFDEK